MAKFTTIEVDKLDTINFQTAVVTGTSVGTAPTVNTSGGTGAATTVNVAASNPLSVPTYLFISLNITLTSPGWLVTPSMAWSVVRTRDSLIVDSGTFTMPLTGGTIAYIRSSSFTDFTAQSSETYRLSLSKTGGTSGSASYNGSLYVVVRKV